MILTPHYAQLPENFYERLTPVEFSQYPVLYWNEALAKDLGLMDRNFYGSVQLALAYAGHQFGHFVPRLGDGRARLVGEIQSPQGVSFEVHLKGSGPTSFSRRGDGLATLSAVLRELIVSEGMHHLGVPTTRTLAVLGTGETVQREVDHPGAIQVRVGQSHVRVGTFEYFASRGDTASVRRLADEMIQRLYPECTQKKNPYIAFFEAVIEKQIQLVVRWMSVGFIHGVMNTDNTAISGETIDYGPCAFMEAYDPFKVFSSIDHQGRYAYSRQPQIIKWNLTVLGYCLVPLFGDNRTAATQMMEEVLAAFDSRYRDVWLQAMAQKLNLKQHRDGDEVLIKEFFDLLHKNEMDFTLSFHQLSLQEPFAGRADFSPWVQKWQTRKEVDLKNHVNPIFIPRNHLVEKALTQASQKNDFSMMLQLLEASRKPFLKQQLYNQFYLAATPQEQVSATFCGT